MNKIRVSCWIFLLVCMPILQAGASEPHKKTDIITLYNGDRITGEIKSLANGLLELSTDAIDTVNIEWQEIAHIESKYNYQVRLSNGKRYYGSITNGDLPGEVKLKDLYGSHEMEYLEIVELYPIEDDVLDRMDVYLSAGFAYTKASSVSQTTFNTNISYEDQNTRNALDARTTLTTTDEDESNSSKVDLTRQVWTDRAKLFRGFYGNFERNDELGVDYRLSAGAGLGRYFIDTYGTRLMGAAGLQVLTERGDASGEQQSVEAFFAGEYAVWRFNPTELDVTLGLSLYPSLTEHGRLRGSSDLRFRWELINDLYWDITAYGSYDNRADSDRNVDYGITTGLGWNY